MNNDPFRYLSGVMKSGIPKGADRAPKVTKTSVSVARPKEFPARTPSGPRDGHPAAKSKANNDGWMGKKTTPSRSGPETLAGHDGMKKSPGGLKAHAAGKKGVETKSATSDKDTHAAVRKTTKTAPVEHGESAMYEKAESKTMKGLKGPKSKVLREGHNTVLRTSVLPRTGTRTLPKPGPRIAGRY